MPEGIPRVLELYAVLQSVVFELAEEGEDVGKIIRKVMYTLEPYIGSAEEEVK